MHKSWSSEVHPSPVAATPSHVRLDQMKSSSSPGISSSRAAPQYDVEEAWVDGGVKFNPRAPAMVEHTLYKSWANVIPATARGLRGYLYWIRCSFVEYYTAIVIFAEAILFSFESLFLILMAGGCPCLFYYIHPNSNMWAYSVSWTLISLAIIFPLTMTLVAAFNRRERALDDLDDIKSSMISLLLAHRMVDWARMPLQKQQGQKQGGFSGMNGNHPQGQMGLGSIARKSTDHVGRVHEVMIFIVDTLGELLMAPMVQRPRHYHTDRGRIKRELVMKHCTMLSARMTAYWGQLASVTTNLVRSGLSAPESTSMQHYTHNIIRAVHRIRGIKDYRTPLGLRAFSKIFIIIMPFITCPYWADLAHHTHIAFSMTISIVTVMAVQGLFVLRYQIEDPFSGYGRDNINVVGELQNLPDNLRILASGRNEVENVTTENGRELPIPPLDEVESISSDDKRF